MNTTVWMLPWTRSLRAAIERKDLCCQSIIASMAIAPNSKAIIKHEILVSENTIRLAVANAFSRRIPDAELSTLWYPEIEGKSSGLEFL